MIFDILKLLVIFGPVIVAFLQRSLSAEAREARLDTDKNKATSHTKVLETEKKLESKASELENASNAW